ncbi:hypothetical protein SNEBB_009764 [Seison nebaliae]|nr:hypothetical protein SNEBB_009764 [Seison nebaliae]
MTKICWSATLLLLIPFLSVVYGDNDLLLRCRYCHEIVDDFQKGLGSTKKGNFGGGNSDWESSRLGNYETSETRFLEIWEKLCENSKEVKQCHYLAEELEERIEDWYMEKQEKEPNLFNYLCVEGNNGCCPKGTFGPKCGECLSDNNGRICSGHGKCDGDGYKFGNGKCSCDTSYSGDLCDECKEGYYETKNDNGDFVCKKCHESCKDECTGEGAISCIECGIGWERVDKKCVDIDECALEDKGNCTDGTYCFNSRGSFSCKPCNRACSKCFSADKSNCEECSTGYRHVEKDGKKICLDIDECIAGHDCKENEFCVNRAGSHECGKCHEACTSCDGPKHSHCFHCNNGFIEDEKVKKSKSKRKKCIDVNECETGQISCNDGEYCENSAGGYKCSDCHRNCESCTGGKRTNCLTCSEGFMKKLTNKDKDAKENEIHCIDKNECEDRPCETAQYCKNLPGSYECHDCHPSCKTCGGSKDNVCSSCFDGYESNQQNNTEAKYFRCVDIDECKDKPCKSDLVCTNTPGSYLCEREIDMMRRTVKEIRSGKDSDDPKPIPQEGDLYDEMDVEEDSQQKHDDL